MRPSLKPVRVDRSGRGDHPHHVALLEAAGSLEGEQAHEAGSGKGTVPSIQCRPPRNPATPGRGRQDGRVRSDESRPRQGLLEQALRCCREAPGPVSLWVGRPGGIPVLELDADRRHFAASTMKLAVLVAAHRAAERGHADLELPVTVHDEFASAVEGTTYRVGQADDSDDEVWAAMGQQVELGWLVRRMVVRSSNLATNLVLDVIGMPPVARVLADAGCGDSVLQRGIEDLVARDAGLTFEFTAADLARLMGALVLGRLTGRHATAAMLATLRGQERTEDVAAGLPAGTRVAHKNGWDDGVRHSVAYVEPGSGPEYVQVVLTSTGWPDDTACALVADVTAAVWADRSALLV